MPQYHSMQHCLKCCIIPKSARLCAKLAVSVNSVVLFDEERLGWEELTGGVKGRVKTPHLDEVFSSSR